MAIRTFGFYLAAVLLGVLLAVAFVFLVPAIPPPLVYEQF